ncbi:MAG: alcohol dehydrogenase catalytic domain-containing protein [Chloroflexi bacterium]|nr:alcohol dehydrogenase catalytic domain-containing protein [Chloroflexota bacterium]
MNDYANRSAYVKSPWQFAVRDNPIAAPAAGQLLIEVKACGVCGTDQHIADRTADDWQPFGHEVAGVVKAVGEGVPLFKVGDRVAVDSSAPCGVCENCSPPPRGRGRPDLCPNPLSYMGSPTMGFGQFLLAYHQQAVPIPDDMTFDVASLVEPLGVCIDLVQVAEVRPGDHVLVIGPGPLGLGAIALAKRAGAAHIYTAGRSTSKGRMDAAMALGTDTFISVDKTPLAEYKFGSRQPDKILITAQPDTIADAIRVAALGGIISYIGVAWNDTKNVSFDADDLHFRKLSIRPSHAWPGTHAAESVRLLHTESTLGSTLISHRFGLEEIEQAMLTARDNRTVAKKVVVIQ